MTILFDCLKHLVNMKIVQKILLSVLSEALKAIWYLAEISESQEDFDKVIDILEILSKAAIDYTLKSSDYDYMNKIINRYLIFKKIHLI